MVPLPNKRCHVSIRVQNVVIMLNGWKLIDLGDVWGFEFGISYASLIAKEETLL